MKFPLMVLLAALPALAQQVEEPFAASAQLTLSGKEGLHRFELPFEAYRDARRDLADVRVLNARGEEVPIAFAGNPDLAREILPALALPVFPVSTVAAPVAGGRTEVTVRTEDGTLVSVRGKGAGASAPRAAAYILDASQVKEPLRALAFDWDAAPGAQVVRVRIESSDDLKAWSLLGAGPLVRLDNGGRTLLQPRVEFTPRTAKYLRITWDVPSFVVSGVRAEREPRAQPAGRKVRVVQAVAGAQAGELTYDLGGALPVEAMRLLPVESNDVISAAISARRGDKDPWRAVAWAPFYRMRIDGVEKQSPPLEIGRMPARYWMVKVPAGGAGASPPALEVTYRGAQVVFVARGEGPFSVAFGKPNAIPAALPVATIYPDYVRFAELSLPEAAVGPVTPGPPPTAWQRMLGGTQPKRVLLWAILVLGVGVMGFMAWRLMRKPGA